MITSFEFSKMIFFNSKNLNARVIMTKRKTIKFGRKTPVTKDGKNKIDKNNVE